MSHPIDRLRVVREPGERADRARCKDEPDAVLALLFPEAPREPGRHGEARQVVVA